KREVPVAKREPDLREHQREREDRSRREPAPAAHEDDERDEPDQELRREHLPERDEGADGGAEGAHKPVARGRPAGKPDPDAYHRERLQHGRRDRERVGYGADEVL